MDLFPTACEAAGVGLDHAIEGRSILPTLLGASQDFSDRHLYWVRREGGSWGDRRYLGLDYHAVRKGDLKLLHNDPFSPLELFDLRQDPKEEHNLSESRQPEVKSLARLMQAQAQKAGSVPWQKSP
jgi:arylsulfatase A-like enzyme